MAAGWSRFAPNLPEIAGRPLELTVPSFWPIIAAMIASFLPVYAIQYRGGNYTEHEESLAAIRAQKEGRPDRRWVGRDVPRISRKPMTNLWELISPYFWPLIAAHRDSKDCKRFKEILRNAFKRLKILKYCKSKDFLRDSGGILKFREFRKNILKDWVIFKKCHMWI